MLVVLATPAFAAHAKYKTLADITKLPQQEQLEHALTLAQQVKATNSRLELLVFIAQTYFDQNELKKATRYFLQAEQLAASLNLPKEQARYAKMQGIAHFYRGYYHNAVESYKRALSIFESLGEVVEMAHVLNNIGLAYTDAELMENAIVNYEQAKAIYVVHGTEQDKADIAHNIAAAYIKSGRFEAALELYNSVMEVYERINDIQGLAQLYGNLGVIYLNLGQTTEAEQAILYALTLLSQTNDTISVINSKTNLAKVYFDTQKYQAALDVLGEIEQLSEQLDNKVSAVAAITIKAKVLYAKGDYEGARKAISRAHALEKEIFAVQKATASDEPNLYLVELLLAAAQGESAYAAKLHDQYESEQNALRNAAISSRLNDFYAKYNNDQLQQQLDTLKQQRNIERLAAQQRKALTWLVVGVVLLSLITTLLMLRRSAERKANALLEQKVQQRTQELEALAQQLRTANEIKSQFLANISHEIRTPLTSIMGQAEAIIHGEVPSEEVASELRVIYNNSQHLGELINDVLDLSKIEANKLDLNMAPVSMAALLADIQAMFELSAEQKGIGFTIDCKLAKDCGAIIDYIRVKQVLVNLCSNAVKFTSEGEVTLSVTQREDGLHFCITDTGIGIDSEQLEVIFANFRQGDNSISRRFGGTGLGLSLSQQLAKIMGGIITVSSKIAEGSCFCFALPCEFVTIAQQQAMSHTANTQEPLQGTVLLAEDHPDNRRLIERMLHALGLTVHCAANGEQAVELALAHHPDLILMDIQMPVLDGIGALELLRKSGFANPIIALTANAMTHDIEKYKQVGFVEHLAKPLEKEKFSRTIARYLNIKTSRERVQVDMNDLREHFLANVVEEISQLKEAHTHSDIDEVARLAHRISGAAKVFQCDDLALIVSDIERAAKYGDLEHVAQLLNDLPQSF
ncbi:ATP-binding protein [Pseudoalteromonas sp. SSDWG2]|uniref:ATP-binding protein n=1 Tax=Pseudoalteromonas sp. SSDWG2 TaxID=3139391 RepID=UPI003BABC538